MKELTNQQSKMIANKIHEYAEMLIYVHEPNEIGKLISKIEMLSEMIINGYGTHTGFEKAFKTIIEI